MMVPDKIKLLDPSAFPGQILQRYKGKKFIVTQNGVSYKVYPGDYVGFDDEGLISMTKDQVERDPNYWTAVKMYTLILKQ